MKRAILFLFLLLLAVPTNHIFAQTASILPLGQTQFFDNNGNPLAGGKVYNYIVGTTTFKTTWQDSAEATSNANPVVLDSAGRALIYGQGTYRQIVRKANGDLVWDAVTSSTGSGGSASTGDGDLVGTVKPWAGITAPSQYAFAYGQELNRTTYATLLTAVTQTLNIVCTASSTSLTGISDTGSIRIGSPLESSCVAAGTTVVSKTASAVVVSNAANISVSSTATFFPWGNGNGSTTFNLPDMRGYVVAGRDNMGGTAAAVLTTNYYGSNSPDALGATGGSQSSTLVTGNLPAYTPSGTNSVSSHIHDEGQAITITGGAGGASLATNVVQNAGGGSRVSTATPTVAVTSTFTGAAQGGVSTPFSRIQPTLTLNYIIKITADTNSAVATGVTDIQGMTGSISCGTGLLCTGNVINVDTGTLFAAPTASVGLTVVTGSASTAMRSDGAPPLSQSIVPTWTGLHTFNAGLTVANTFGVNFKNSTSSSGNAIGMLAGDNLSVGDVNFAQSLRLRWGGQITFETGLAGANSVKATMLASGCFGLGTAVDCGAPGILNLLTGIRIANAATSGNYLRGNGTNFVSNTIQQSDLPETSHPGYAVMYPHSDQASRPNTGTGSEWIALDPWGNPITCTGTTSQCLQEFLTATTTNSWPARVYCQGTKFPSGTEPVVIEATTSVTVPVAQDWDFRADGTCNLNFNVTTVPGLIIDSKGASNFEWAGKIVYNVTSPNGNTNVSPSCPVVLKPTTNTQDGFPGIYASKIRIATPTGPGVGGTAAMCIDIAGGAVAQNQLNFGEINGGNSFKGLFVYGAGSTYNFAANIIDVTESHGATEKMIDIGFDGTNKARYYGNLWRIANIQAGSASAIGIDTWGSNDIFDIGNLNGGEGGLATGLKTESGANNNTFRYALIQNATSAAYNDGGTCNAFEGPQGTRLALFGTTSGCAKIITSAVAGSPVLTIGLSTGTIPVINSGTTQYGVVLAYDGVNAITTTTAGPLDQVLLGQGAAYPIFGTVNTNGITNNAVTVDKLAQASANTMLGNWSGSTANIAANSMPSCPDSGGNHLNYVSGTGIICGTGLGNGITALTGDVTATGPGSVAATLATAQPNTHTWAAIQKFNLNSGAVPTAQTGSIIQAVGADTTAARIEISAFGAQAFFTSIAYGGTNSSKTALTSGTQIGGYNSYGYNGSSVVGPVGTFRCFAAETWTTLPKQGSYCEIATTANGGTTLTSVMRWENSGGVTVPSTVTGGDKGVGTLNASGLYVNGTAVSTTTGTVTSIATTSPITGGTITSTGTIACATCVTSAASLTSNSLMIGAGSQASAVTTTASGMLTFLGTPTSANLAATITNETGTGLLVFNDAPSFTSGIGITAPSNALAIAINGRVSDNASNINFYQNNGSTLNAQISVTASQYIHASSNGVITYQTNGGEQVRITDTASASRYVTLTGSNGGNPTIGVSAGSLNLSSGVTFTVGTASTSKTTGSAIITGGLGVSGAVFTDTLNVITVANAATTAALCWNSGTGLITENGAVGTCTVSLLSAKNLIRPLTNKEGFNIVMAMEPWRYTMKKGLPTWIDGEQIGFVADYAAKIEVAKPIVAYNHDGSLGGIRYEQYTAALTAAFKYLKADNDNLHAEIREIKRRIGAR